MSKLPLLVPSFLLERKLFNSSRMMGLMGLALLVVMLAVPLSFATGFAMSWDNSTENWLVSLGSGLDANMWLNGRCLDLDVIVYWANLGNTSLDATVAGVLNGCNASTDIQCLAIDYCPQGHASTHMMASGSVYTRLSETAGDTKDTIGKYWVHDSAVNGGYGVGYTGDGRYYSFNIESFCWASPTPIHSCVEDQYGAVTFRIKNQTENPFLQSLGTTFTNYSSLISTAGSTSYFLSDLGYGNDTGIGNAWTYSYPFNELFTWQGTHAFYGSETVIDNTLNAVVCEDTVYPFVSYNQYDVNIPTGIHDIYCNNGSEASNVTRFFKYNVIKFINTTGGRVDAYFGAYSSNFMYISNVMNVPANPLPNSNVTVYWQTTLAANSTLYWRMSPIGSSSYTSWVSQFVNESVYDHTLTINRVNIVDGYFYQYYVSSGYMIANNSGSYYNFTVTSVPTTTTTIPSISCNSGMIQSVSYDDRYPSLDQTVRFDIYITNDGIYACNYSVGLSVGNVTSNVWCNHDCYDDGFGDFGHTGTVAAGHTVMVTRYYKFRHEFFLPSRNYSVAVGLYPYDYSVSNFDYDIFSNAITTQSIAEKAGGGVLAYPLSVSIKPSSTRRGAEVKVTSFVLNNGSVTYNFKLGMSLGIWDKNESVIYNVTQPALIHPCNVECYTDDLGDWVYIEIPPNYTAPFIRSFTIPDYFLENTSYDVAVGVYVGDVLVAIRYFDNKGFVQIGTSSGQPQEILEPTGAMIGALLGITTSSGVLLIIFIIVMGVGIYAAYKTKHAEIGVMVMVLMIIAFFIAGKIPLWIMILVVVIASAIVARMFGNIFGGGG